MLSDNIYIDLISELSINSRGENKYLNWYLSIIIKAQNRNLIEYTETHHIVPECFYIIRKRKGPPGFLSGTGEHKNNFVDLTPKEHLVIHLILIKMFSKTFVKYDSLVFGATKMHRDPYGNRINSEIYNWVRVLDSNIKSKNMSGKNNPMYGTPCTYNMTEEQIKSWKTNIGNALRGVPKPPRSPETCLKISKSKKGSTPWNKGKIGVQSKSLESKMKISIPITFRGIEYYSLADAVNKTGITGYKIKKEIFGDGTSGLKTLIDNSIELL